MSSQREITLGAFGVLDGIAGIPDLAWPNVDFTPANEYVAIYLLPAESESDSLGCDALIGLIQASVYVRDGKGVIGALVYADLIRAAFTKGLETTNGSTSFMVTKTPWDAPIIVEDGWCQIPISIPYKTFN